MIKQNPIFNGIGYISNRGRSRYWGVSACKYNVWRLNINSPVKGTKTLAFDWTPTEDTAAKIAACLYPIREKIFNSPVTIVDVDGDLFKVSSKASLIERIPSQLKSKFSVDSSLKDLNKGDNVITSLFDQPDLLQGKPKVEKVEKFDGNTDVIKSVYKWIMDDKIDKKTATLVKSMMETIAK